MADREAPRPAGPDRSQSAVQALDVLCVAAVAIAVASGRADVPFHGDESTFVWMSRDAYTLVEGRGESLRFDPETREPLAQWLRVLNGSVHPLAVGAALIAAGTKRDELNEPWIWVLPRRPAEQQWEFNVAAGRLPDEALLHLARAPAAIATAASVALVFAIALGASRSRVAAWTAVACYATTPAVLLNGRRAMQEGALLFTTALVVWIALRLIRSNAPAESARSGAIPLPSLLALAVATGVAVAAKHAVFPVVLAAWLAVACRPLLANGRTDARGIAREEMSLLGAGIASIAVFTLVSPVWWSAPRTLALVGLAALLARFGLPVTRRAGAALAVLAVALIVGAFVARPDLAATARRDVGHLVSERQALVREQLGGADRSFAARVAALAREAFVATPQFYEDPTWAGFPEIAAQIDAYRASWLTGRTGPWRWLGLALAALVGMGLVALVRRPRDPEKVLLLAWLCVPAAALLASPLDWQRYYLPMHAPLAVIAGHGAATLWKRRAEPA